LTPPCSTAVERLPQRLAAEEPLRLVAHLQRADERHLELVRRDRVEAAAAPLRELGPELDFASRRDELRRLARARQVARDDEVERDACERRPRRLRLLAPACGQRHRLRPHRLA
jgi:hypothetical protein